MRHSASPVSATSIPVERVVDGSSDVSSTMSSDHVEKIEDPLSPSPLPTSPSPLVVHPSSTNDDNNLSSETADVTSNKNNVRIFACTSRKLETIGLEIFMLQV